MKKAIVLITVGVLFLGGCALTSDKKSIQTMKKVDENKEVVEETVEKLTFVDAHGEEYTIEVNSDWRMHDYDNRAYTHKGDKLVYEGDENYSYKLGIDVSYFQGDIDWNAVKQDGYEFAIIRVGYRGYGEAGNICEDNMAVSNLKGAKAAGLDVGVYFFSQAISEEEAKEEAEFAFKVIEKAGFGPDDLAMPVVYDPESILNDDSRTDDVTGEQFTKNSVAFCETVEQKGYKPMVYCNMKWEAYELDLGILKDYPIWYADYERIPQTPYKYEMWQYSEKSSVSGVSGAVDTNILLIENQ